jgi:hypothetical protein
MPWGASAASLDYLNVFSLCMHALNVFGDSVGLFEHFFLHWPPWSFSLAGNLSGNQGKICRSWITEKNFKGVASISRLDQLGKWRPPLYF